MNRDIPDGNRLKHALLAVALATAAHAVGAQATGNTPADPTQPGTGAATGAVIDRTASAPGAFPAASAQGGRAAGESSSAPFGKRKGSRPGRRPGAASSPGVKTSPASVG